MRYKQDVCVSLREYGIYDECYFKATHLIADEFPSFTDVFDPKKSGGHVHHYIGTSVWLIVVCVFVMGSISFMCLGNISFVCLSYFTSSLFIFSFHPVYHGPSHNHKVNRLAELTSHEFRIYASNDAGDGPYSEIFRVSTTKAPPPACKCEYYHLSHGQCQNR